jgi:hypothetical protein
MAKRTVKIVADESGELTLDGEKTELPEDSDELRALAELDPGGDITFQIWKTMPINEKGFVGQLTASELTVEKIQQEFGKGRYRVRGIRSNGTYAKQTTIDIARDPKGSASAVSAQAATPMQDYIAFIDAREARSSQNMREWATILAPLGAALIPALIGNKGPTLAELTTTLTNLKSLNGGNDSSLGKIEEVTKLIEAVRGIGGDEKTGSTWVDLIRDGVKELGPAIGAIVATRLPGISAPPAALPKLATPPAAAPAAVPAPTPEGKDPMSELLSWLREQLEGLVTQAKRNSDPNLYADVVLDNLPDGVDPAMLKNFLAKSDWWASLTMFYPPVRPHAKWFTDCRQALLAGLEEMLAPPAEPTPVADAMPFDTEASADE